jgi:hypothetical protein
MNNSLMDGDPMNIYKVKGHGGNPSGGPFRKGSYQSLITSLMTLIIT